MLKFKIELSKDCLAVEVTLSLSLLGILEVVTKLLGF